MSASESPDSGIKNPDEVIDLWGEDPAEEILTDDELRGVENEN
ncbi:hypothetical protein [Natronolimnobius baerhuensis]|nr:hypothetical protein [Natronolimnobius baerhuensis]